MPLAIEQTGQEADRHGDRRGLFLLDTGQDLLLQPGQFLFREGGIEHDIGKDIKSGIEIRFERREGDRGGIEPRSGSQPGTQQGELLAETARGLAAQQQFDKRLAAALIRLVLRRPARVALGLAQRLVLPLHHAVAQLCEALGIVGDVHKVLPKLIEALKAR